MFFFYRVLIDLIRDLLAFCDDSLVPLETFMCTKQLTKYFETLKKQRGGFG